MMVKTSLFLRLYQIMGLDKFFLARHSGNRFTRKALLAAFTGETSCPESISMLAQMDKWIPDCKLRPPKPCRLCVRLTSGMTNKGVIWYSPLFFSMALMVFVGASPVSAQSKAALCHLAGADYVPGIDVHGKMVASANLNAGVENSADVVRIPVTIDLAKQLTQTLPAGTEMKTQFSMVEIYQNSRVVFNGKDVSGEVSTLCGKEPVFPSVEINKEKTKEEKKIKEEIIWGEGY